MYVETGFCGYEVDERDWGAYIWPEIKGGNSVTLKCQLDGGTVVTRKCLNGGGWEMANYTACISILLKVSGQPRSRTIYAMSYCESIV